jgi:hypothetical protein
MLLPPPPSFDLVIDEDSTADAGSLQTEQIAMLKRGKGVEYRGRPALSSSS